MSPTPERFMWAFTRAMEYIANGEVRNGMMSFASDASKIDLDLGIMGMACMMCQNAEEAIKIMAGFPSAPDEVKKYYDNPQSAMEKWKK
jgi:hypothetical protein